jgi:hypothetical protein
MIFGYFTLIVALLISAVSAWYSILGLTAIFAGAVVPAVIMGVSLELGKIMVAVWLHQNWRRDRLLKFYLIPALIFLMMLTSIGVFGFLSKAHVDQNLVSGDVIAEIAIYDEKIKIERENIDADRKQLKQMDEAVDQVMGRSSDETGAERAVAIRRSQQKERGRLLAEITEGQKRITALNEERAPIAAKARKVEAEVGPVKYVAALFSNNTPDQDQLERAVRWVIILIVAVFDPLAIVLIIAGIKQLGWGRQDSAKDAWPASGNSGGLVTIDDMIVGIKPNNLHPELSVAPVPAKPDPDSVIEDHLEEIEQLYSELRQAQQDRDTLADFVREQDQTLKDRTQELTQVRAILTNLHNDHNSLSDLNARSLQREQDLQAELEQTKAQLATIQAERDLLFQAHSYEMTRADTLTQQVETVTIKPEIFVEPAVTAVPMPDPVAVEEPAVAITPVPTRQPAADFGDTFPNTPARGDMFLRTDFKPSRLFKWNDVKWIEVNKNTTDVYNYNDAYLQFLVEKISTGEYSIDDLSPTEQYQIRTMLGSR